MARENKLTAAKASAALKETGKTGDGGGLWLTVTVDANGILKRAAWVYVFVLHGKRREMGLGSATEVGLAEARKKRDEARALVRAHKDPIEARKEEAHAAAEAARKASEVPTLAENLAKVFERDKAKWKSAKHAADWRRTFKQIGKLGEMRVDRITVDDIAKGLKTLWEERQETANRVRGRIEAAIDVGIVQGHRTAENPARKKLVSVLLANTKKKVEHHRAMPYADAPGFIARLREMQAVSEVAWCLEFGVLTATRLGEFIGARWEEIDLDAGVWAIPEHRMKAGKKHEVALSSRAVAILKRQAAIRRGDYVFPSPTGRAHLSKAAIRSLLIRMNALDETSIHGWRSTFRNWAAAETDAPHEICEAALAHARGAVERAYWRENPLEKLRKLFEQWAQFLDGKEEPKNKGEGRQCREASQGLKIGGRLRVWTTRNRPDLLTLSKDATREE